MESNVSFVSFVIKSSLIVKKKKKKRKTEKIQKTISLKMNSKTPASVKSTMTLYSSISFCLLCNTMQTLVTNKSHVLDLRCFLSSALIRVTFFVFDF